MDSQQESNKLSTCKLALVTFIGENGIIKYAIVVVEGNPKLCKFPGCKNEKCLFLHLGGDVLCTPTAAKLCKFCLQGKCNAAPPAPGVFHLPPGWKVDKPSLPAEEFANFGLTVPTALLVARQAKPKSPSSSPTPVPASPVPSASSVEQSSTHPKKNAKKPEKNRRPPVGKNKKDSKKADFKNEFSLMQLAEICNKDMMPAFNSIMSEFQTATNQQDFLNICCKLSRTAKSYADKFGRERKPKFDRKDKPAKKPANSTESSTEEVPEKVPE